LKKIELTKSQIRRKLTLLNKLNLKDKPIDFIYKELKIILNNFWTDDLGRPDLFEIWRTRKGKFTNLDELWYPPKEYIRNFGRLNDNQEQIFYSCFGHNANLGSLEEIRAKPGDIITQIKCDLIQPDKRLKMVGLGHINKWMSSKNLELKNSYKLNALDLKNKIGEKEFNKNLIVKEWLNTLFLKKVLTGEEYKYKLTIAISKHYFNGFKADGILFPSIASYQKAVNLVLKPNIADKYAIFRYARIIEIIDITEEGYKLKILDEANKIDKYNNFIWLKA